NAGAMAPPLAIVEPHGFLPCGVPIHACLQLYPRRRQLAHHGDQAVLRKPGSANLDRVIAIGQARLALPLAAPPSALVSSPPAAAPRRPKDANAPFIRHDRRSPVHTRLAADRLFARPVLAIEPACDNHIFTVVRPLPLAKVDLIRRQFGRRSPATV